MWGQEAKQVAFRPYARIIPMRVGTRSPKVVMKVLRKDHPHACGDKRNIVLPLRTVIGSSPCVWGQEKQTVFRVCKSRIIPMRVGTSNPLLQAPPVVWDHPHACGDKTHSLGIVFCRMGSSPCVWGQDKKICFYRHNTRIIPMRVGTRFRRVLLWHIM